MTTIIGRTEVLGQANADSLLLRASPFGYKQINLFFLAFGMQRMRVFPFSRGSGVPIGSDGVDEAASLGYFLALVVGFDEGGWHNEELIVNNNIFLFMNGSSSICINTIKL
jgi:hypothetical protein